jgi:hypothetical protein
MNEQTSTTAAADAQEFTWKERLPACLYAQLGIFWSIRALAQVAMVRAGWLYTFPRGDSGHQFGVAESDYIKNVAEQHAEALLKIFEIANTTIWQLSPSGLGDCYDGVFKPAAAQNAQPCEELGQAELPVEELE